MYDLAVIGAGWAGFNAALRAKELGLAVCLIESRQIGGTCLNHGCIPTKALITCAKIFSLAKRSADFGVELDNLRLNWRLIQERKNKVIRHLAQGMHSRMSGINFINSVAQITGPGEITVDGQVIRTKFILIATGSSPAELPELKFDQERIISSDQALTLGQIPQSLLVVGGGVIGCEFAGLFATLGSRVTIIEKMPGLLPAEDKEVSRKIESIFKKKGIQVYTGADLSTLDLKPYDKILVCTGRTPNSQGLAAQDLGLVLEGHKIIVDAYLKTSVGNIYAAGDCTAKSMLAHYAAYQGVVAVENMFSGNKQAADYSVVPVCIFTDPQIASVGVKENAASVYPGQAKVYRFDFRANALAQIADETEGWIKIITAGDNGPVIGASIIGPQATELISVLSTAINAGFTAVQFRAMIFAHPTLAEGIQEAFKHSGGI